MSQPSFGPRYPPLPSLQVHASMGLLPSLNSGMAGAPWRHALAMMATAGILVQRRAATWGFGALAAMGSRACGGPRAAPSAATNARLKRMAQTPSHRARRQRKGRLGFGNDTATA